jgi:hypothetical protein
VGVTGDDGYEYLVGIKDEMSAQSKAIASALDQMTSALGRSDHAVKSHGQAHQEAARHVKEHESAIKGFLSAMARSAVGGGIGGGLTSEIAKGTLIAHGVEKAGDLVGEGVRFAIEASEFKENAIAAYTAVRGTAEEGERTFTELDKAAREIHMPAERAHALAQSLMLEGLESQKAITDTVRAVGALQTVGLQAGADKLQSIIGRSLAEGHLQLSGKSLVGTGVSIEDLYTELATKLGQGRKQIKEELASGKIDVETGIEAIDSAILRGKIGALATKKFTVSDALVDMKNAIRGVLQETDSGPVVDAFKRMSGAFVEGGESAKDTKEAINALIELGGGLLDLTTGIGKGLVGAINALKSALQAAGVAGGFLLDKLHGVASSAASIFQSAEDKRFSKQAETDADKKIDKELRTKIERAKLDAINEFQKAPHTTEEIHAFGKKMNVDLYNAAKEEPAGKSSKDERELRNLLKHPTGAITVGALSPQASFEASGRGETSLPPAAHKPNLDVGVKLDLNNLGKDAGHALHSGAKDALDAHSPSRKMYELGEDAADGFKAGAAAASESRRGDYDRMGPSTSTGKQIHVDVSVGGIHMQGMASAEDFAPFLESQVADVFERVAMELGQ